jgi:hypothetical protein
VKIELLLDAPRADQARCGQYMKTIALRAAKVAACAQGRQERPFA